MREHCLRRRRRARRLVAAVAPVVLLLGLTACSGTHRTASPATSPVGADPGLVRPGSVYSEAGADPARVRAVVHTAQVLYTFWNTGDTSYLDRAIAPTFRDRTLPAGRPQGPRGIRAASAGFRAAVPDLTCRLAEVYVTGDTFTARLVFRGHFTGVYDGHHGRGQRIDFGAIDIQHVDGPGHTITEDWHLEDNLTFLQQAGIT